MRRILVVKLADIGDLLTATPAVRALRMTFPDARIDALVTPQAAPVIDGNDAVDRVIQFPKALFDDPRSLIHPLRGARAVGTLAVLAARLRAGRYDTVVLLHHLVTPWGVTKYRALVSATGAPLVAGLDNGRGAFLTHRAPDLGFGERHEVDYCLDVVGAIGARHPAPRMELFLNAGEIAEARRVWDRLGLGSEDVVALHPGSGAFSLARRWAPERFAEVGDALASEGKQVAILAGPGEEALAETVRAGMRSAGVIMRGLSIRGTAAVLQQCRLLVGNDSGVTHLAAAVQTPVVAVFGLTNHRAWGPYPPADHTVVRLDLQCSPCLYRGLDLGNRFGCPPRSCLEDLPASLVIAAARRQLARAGGELHRWAPVPG
jgi:heptosyltransferase-2